MEKLIIKNGQFFRGGEVAPTMIGDAEQIATLKRYQRKGATKSRVKLQIKGTVEFECICGVKILDEINKQSDAGFSTVWTCPFCGERYKISVSKPKVQRI